MTNDLLEQGLEASLSSLQAESFLTITLLHPRPALSSLGRLLAPAFPCSLALDLSSDF